MQVALGKSQGNSAMVRMRGDGRYYLDAAWGTRPHSSGPKSRACWPILSYSRTPFTLYGLPQIGSKSIANLRRQLQADHVVFPLGRSWCTRKFRWVIRNQTNLNLLLMRWLQFFFTFHGQSVFRLHSSYILVLTAFTFRAFERLDERTHPSINKGPHSPTPTYSRRYACSFSQGFLVSTDITESLYGDGIWEEALL